MKKKLKGDKGINLISLTVSVMVILILVGTILYNLKDNLGIQNLKNMQSDIGNLRDKISSFYAQYGKIPADKEYTNIEHINVTSNVVDTGKFYIIDLAAMENVTLTYGRDYENIETAEDVNVLQDLYIINETSHNIFYVKGIKLDEETFYTDYNKENVDKVAIEKIEITENDERWSPEYDKTSSYKDENGDTATIPKGFKVSRNIKNDSISEGLVVCAPDGSEFVWVPVETVISNLEQTGTKNKAMAINLGTIQEPKYRGLLYNFAGTSSEVISDCTTTTTEYREPYNLEVYDTNTNISNWEKTLYQQEYNTMIEKVKKYGGFYVGRYETSINGETVASKLAIPMSADDNVQAWYGMYDIQKSYATKNNLSDIVGSSMIWGSQYDAIMNWILTNSTENGKITANSVTHNLIATGATETDKINNIYDLGNNLSEWTLEANEEEKRVARGGNWNSNNSPSYRDNNYNPSQTQGILGSRMTLYIK